MKQKVEAIIILVTFSATTAAHMAVVPAGIVYTYNPSASIALAVYVASLLALLLPTFILVVITGTWAMERLEGGRQQSKPEQPKPDPPSWTVVNANGSRQPEVERRVNKRRRR